MKIIALTETQFRNYSRLHSNRNYLQSVEYAKMQSVYGFEILYLGLVDDDNNLNAGCLILGKNAFSRISYGICPGGFLVDYTNFKLLKEFTNALKKYLVKKGYVYVQVEPRSIIHSANKKNEVIFTSDTLLNNLVKLNYLPVDNNVNNKYAVYLDAKDEKSLYDNFNRSIKRSIKDCKMMGISIYRGNESNFELFYNLIKANTGQEIGYYYNYMNSFSNPNNSFEIYFAKLDTKIYLSNVTELLNKEQVRNDRLNNKMKNKQVSSKLLNKKFSSDKIVQKYNMKLNEAINLFDRYPNGVIISTCAIIKNNKDVSFIIDGYNLNLKNIRSLAYLKYEVMREYVKQGYTSFNLGFLPIDKSSDNFKKLYTVKMNMGANFVEFPDAFHLIINKLIYSMPMVEKTQARYDT